MKVKIPNTLYEVKSTSRFNSDLKKIANNPKRLSKLIKVVETLANGKSLASKYRDHQLINDNIYKNCRECHIEPDWLLVYKYKDDELVLILFATGSHSNLFKK